PSSVALVLLHAFRDPRGDKFDVSLFHFSRSRFARSNRETLCFSSLNPRYPVILKEVLFYLDGFRWDLSAAMEACRRKPCWQPRPGNQRTKVFFLGLGGLDPHPQPPTSRDQLGFGQSARSWTISPYESYNRLCRHRSSSSWL
ncbi:unnamed protein product, partial [Brassica oleracea var. botrytis]